MANPFGEGHTVADALKIRDILLQLPPTIECVNIGRELVQMAVATASVVLWKDDIRQAAVAGSEAFIGQPAPRLSPPFQLWVLEHPTAVSPGAAKAMGWPPGSLNFALLVWNNHSGELNAAFIGEQPGAQKAFITAVTLVEQSGPGSLENLAALKAMCAFMEQEFISVERQQLPRHLRRAAEMKRRPPLPEINVVTLRRSAREDKPHGYQGSARDFSCQWLVGAHWRKQLCRKRDANGEKTKDGAWEVRPVYVPAHVKGPEDKPLRQPRGTVYAVTR